MNPDYLAIFREHCAALRELGATEIVVGDMRATFGAPPPTPRVIPTPKPEKKRKPSPVADVFPDQPGDTQEDKERRARYRDAVDAMVGT